MIKNEAIQAARAAYDIEAACITEMKEFIDDAASSVPPASSPLQRQFTAPPVSCRRAM